MFIVGETDRKQAVLIPLSSVASILHDQGKDFVCQFGSDAHAEIKNWNNYQDWPSAYNAYEKLKKRLGDHVKA